MLTEENKSNRRNGIGASESSILFPEIPNNRKTPLQLWMEKTNQVSPEIIDNDFTWWGNELEPLIAKRYELETGEKTEFKEETFFHKDMNYMICHPDRFIIGKRKLLEIKTASFQNELWGDSIDEIPFQYLIQAQHQMSVTGYDEVDVFVLFMANRKTKIYNIKRDEQIIEAIENKVKYFWEENVQKLIPPNIENTSDCKIYFKNYMDDFSEANEESLKNIQKIVEINKQIKQINEEKEHTLKSIYCEIGNSLGLKIGSKILATWKPRKDNVRVFRLAGEI